MSTEDALVVFTPSGKRGRFKLGTPLLQAARSLGVDIDSVCGGRALCGRCQVLVMEGEFAKHGVKSQAQNVSAVSQTELAYARRRTLRPGHRLSCSAHVLGDVIIDVPSESQVHRQVIRKGVDSREITLDSIVRLRHVEVRQPDMADPSGDLRRLCEALEREWQLSGLTCDTSVLPSLQSALRRGEWKVTAAVRDDSQIVGVWPGLHEAAYGIAFDIGSTTIAAHLCSLVTGEVVAASGMMNPQIRFGEDLMSRVSYSMMNPGGAEQMTQAVRAAINDLSTDVARAASISVEDILEITVVGNPIMHHLFLGIDPVELGGAPFALATDESLTLRASDLDLKLHPNARVYVLPCIAGHVGADAAGVILAERPDLRDELTLLVDVGTNAEIVLGNRARLLACSSPTGPAFEGAQISCGQRATAGAIERVRIDRTTLAPAVRVIGADAWSDEPAFASTAPTVTGVCGSGIVSALAELFLAGVVDADGTILGAAAERTPHVVADGRTFAYVLYDDGDTRLTITQNDVRAIQLAKAALRAGIDLLVEHSGFTDLADIRLAGAFGAHIDPVDAMVLGLIPDAPRAAVRAVGNAAGAGAVRALVSRAQRAEIATAVRRVTKIETATEPRFQELFVAAMAFPHATASTPYLAAQVELPARRSATTGRRRTRARRTTDE